MTPSVPAATRPPPPSSIRATVFREPGPLRHFLLASTNSFGARGRLCRLALAAPSGLSSICSS
eukprot:4380691-Alexandrium_andersonii.AAC.1